MIIIEDKSTLKQHLLDESKTVGAIEIGGPVHEGHGFIINEVRKLVDILIVVYFEWLNPVIDFYKTEQWNTDKKYTLFNDVSKSIIDIPELCNIVDFLVNSPLTEHIKKQTEDNIIHNDKCYILCKDLGLNNSHLYYILIAPIQDNDLNVDLKQIKYYIGCKNILPDIIAKRLLSSDKVYNPEYIWKPLRNEKTSEIISRSSNRKVFGIISKLIYDEIIKNGHIDNIKLNEIKNKFGYIHNLDIPIIDLQELKRINKTNNNCVIVCNDEECADYIFIKNGKLIWE